VVAEGLHAVCPFSRHDPPGWRGVSRHPGSRHRWGEDGPRVLVGLLRKSRAMGGPISGFGASRLSTLSTDPLRHGWRQRAAQGSASPFGKKLVQQCCAIKKSRNLQRHLARPYRSEVHRRLIAALEQTSYADAWRMLRELEAWLRTKNESTAVSLAEASQELLTLHRLQVPALLRKTLLSTNPIESMFSLVRHSERNI